MDAIQHANTKLRQILQYPYVQLSLALAVALFGLLHYELRQKKSDLLAWIDYFTKIYKDLGYFPCFMLIAILILKVLFLIFVTKKNRESMKLLEDLWQFEVRSGYVNFEYMYLSKDVENLNYKRVDPNEVILLKSFLRAHEDMCRDIEKFREQTQKLFDLNNVRDSPPTEEDSYTSENYEYDMNIGDQIYMRPERRVRRNRRQPGNDDINNMPVHYPYPPNEEY